MMNLKSKKYSFIQKLTSLLFIFIFTLGIIYNIIPVQAASAAEDAAVTNTASFSTDVIYQIVTDRFFDGNPSNNPTGSIFDKSNLQKYHGGDWAGITQKLNEGYFTGMGVTALWISSPVENISTIDPSNNCASYHGYWAKDFFKTNPYFGSVNDFQTMISTAHALGIKIVIDFAPNHTSTAEYGTMTFPEDGALYKNGTYLGGFKNDTLGLSIWLQVGKKIG